MSEAVPEDAPIVLFDGVCNLCNGVVQFVVQRDPEGQFYFASLQSDVGAALLAERGLAAGSGGSGGTDGDADGDSADEEYESIVLIEGDDYWQKSDAALRIATRLGGVYRLLGPLRYVPRAIRDRVYDVVAANRYRWFGKKDRCARPTDDAYADVQSRFLE